MPGCRAFFRRRPGFALWLLLSALFVRAVVPAGYMPGIGPAEIIRLCTTAGPVLQSVDHGLASDAGDDDHRHAAADQPCAFGALGAPVLGGASPVLLALALAFIVAAGFLDRALPARRPPAHLRPPAQGPPRFF